MFFSFWGFAAASAQTLGQQVLFLLVLAQSYIWWWLQDDVPLMAHRSFRRGIVGGRWGVRSWRHNVRRDNPIVPHCDIDGISCIHR